jgi:hypothetical protein
VSTRAPLTLVRAGVDHIVLVPVAAAETDETDETGSLRRIVGAVLPHIRPPRH